MRLTAEAILGKKRKGEKLVCLSAYDFPSARAADEEGVDIVLVGDSVGMVLLGLDSTTAVTMEDMLHHTKAVARAVKRALVTGDMPYGSYNNPKSALRNAERFLKEGGADAVKLEGGVAIEKQVQALRNAKIPVMGHVGMLPQSAEKIGGYKVQGKDTAGAEKILKDAILLDHLGVFSLVLECVPAALAERITQQVKCPTIGIGAGPKTDGQILVLPDLLGIRSGVSPKFVRRYANLEKEIRSAVAAYREDVLQGKFPSPKESY